VARGSPAISGVMRAALSCGSPVSDSSMRATTDSPVVVSSSMPSVPCTTKARLAPSAASVRPTRRTRLGARTPTTCVRACAGLVSGPTRLKMVRKPSARREEEDEAGFAETLDGQLRREVDRDAESFKYVGSAAARSDGAIAMLGDAGSGGRSNERGTAGDVEGLRAAATSADTVDKLIALRIGERHGRRVPAHDVHKASQFGSLLAACGEDCQQSRRLHLRHGTSEDLLEHFGSLLARERAAVLGERAKQFFHQRHERSIAERRLLSEKRIFRGIVEPLSFAPTGLAGL